MTLRHPNDVLFAGEKPFPVLPVVDHYAGSEKLMKKAYNCKANWPTTARRSLT